MPAVVRKAFPLRLDPALHAAVERMAAAELRSVNAQIEFLLREALKSRSSPIPPPPAGEGEANEVSNG